MTTLTERLLLSYTTLPFMRSLVRIVSMIVFYGSGLLMWFFYVGALIDWIGGLFGMIVGIAVAPGAVIFPFIYWMVEGAFPTDYFLLWGIGLVAMFVAGWASED